MAHMHADRFFEIRFESIGGLGAHAAGQVLATAAVLRMGLNGAHFSSYGSEKKGSLVRSFVRLGPTDRPIRTSAPVETPGRHRGLPRGAAAQPGDASPDSGRTARSSTTRRPGPVPEELAALPRTARVIRVDALGIAMQGEVAAQRGAARHALRRVSVPRRRRRPGGALRGVRRQAPGGGRRRTSARSGAAPTEFEVLEGVGRAEGDLPVARAEPAWGYETQPVGGIIPEPGNTVVERPVGVAHRLDAGPRPREVHPLRPVRPGLPGPTASSGATARRAASSSAS